MRAKYIVLILLLSCVSMYSQSKKIDYVALEYNNWGHLAPGNSIDIQITPISKSKAEIIGTIDRKKIEMKISIEDYYEICDSLLLIEGKDILENVGVYLDGTETKLSFGIHDNIISYSVAGIDRGDETTNFKEFLQSMRMILKVIKVKLEEVN